MVSEEVRSSLTHSNFNFEFLKYYDLNVAERKTQIMEAYAESTLRGGADVEDDGDGEESGVESVALSDDVAESDGSLD